MITNELTYTSNAYYEKGVHFEKMFLMQSQYASKSLLSEHEFNFLKNNSEIICKYLLEILKKHKNNPNLCFESVYNFFESFMPSFLDGFFAVFLDAHILDTSNRHFNKEYFLKNIDKETEAWPKRYNQNIIKKCVYEDFPKYVLLKNNTISTYFFIRYGWLEYLYQFIKLFNNSNNSFKNEAVSKKNLVHKQTSKYQSFNQVLEWVNYEFYSASLYSYITNNSKQILWKRCDY